jgi:hypothetical protein
VSVPPGASAGDDAGSEPDAGPRAGRPGRRRNGLTASAYAALVDIDPQLATALLGALHRAGIAAYVEPVPGSMGGYLEVRLPDRPTDRLWCDHRQRELARTVVEQVLAEAVSGMAEPPPDPAWEAVLASWRLAGGADPSAVPERPDPRSQTGDADDLPDDHYVPPPPPPLPRVQPATRWAVVAMVGGLIALAAPWLLGLNSSPTTATLAVLAIVGAAATMVWRMHDGSGGDSGSDDGAVV